MDAVVDQVALPVVDLPVPAVPDVAFRCRRGRFLGGEPVLILGEKPYAIGEQCGGLRPRHLAGVARIVVPAQLDRAPWRYPQRFDEVGNEAKTLVHPLTMPIPTSPRSRYDDQMT